MEYSVSLLSWFHIHIQLLRTNFTMQVEALGEAANYDLGWRSIRLEEIQHGGVKDGWIAGRDRMRDVWYFNLSRLGQAIGQLVQDHVKHNRAAFSSY
jgi:hypothetical protein